MLILESSLANPEIVNVNNCTINFQWLSSDLIHHCTNLYKHIIVTFFPSSLSCLDIISNLILMLMYLCICSKLLF